MTFDQYDYRIAAHFLPALINGDESGLSLHEQNALAGFDAGLPGAGHWDCDEEEHFARCDVTGEFASVVDCRYFVPRA